MWLLLTLNSVYNSFFVVECSHAHIKSTDVSPICASETIQCCGHWAHQARAPISKWLADFFARKAIVDTKNICIFFMSICVIYSSTKFVDGICLRAISCEKNWLANYKANTSYGSYGLYWIAIRMGDKHKTGGGKLQTHMSLHLKG